MATAKDKYSKGETSRGSFLQRGREASRLTIPSLLPEEGSNGDTDFETPYQALGARGVNNLASKLLLALLPPNSPFFRLRVNDKTLRELEDQEGAKAKIEEALGQIERTVQDKIEVDALRVYMFEALKQLIVAGNVLLYLPKDGGMRVFRLDRYVVFRDYNGKPKEIIVKETVAVDSLPKSIQADLENQLTQDKEGNSKSVDVFTHIYLKGASWHVYQEVKGLIVPGSQGSYPKDKLPWLPLRYIRIEGEDYGRGFIEEYLGDLQSLDGLYQAVIETSAAMAKLLIFVNPNGTTDQETIAEAENGAVVDGDGNDVSVLQMEKYPDLQVTLRTIEMLEKRLSAAYLLQSAVQRDAERVTAEEVRLVAQELDQVQAGLYGILGQELQYPLVKIYMWRMSMSGELPALPEDTFSPMIVTGLEALGRGQDLQNLQAFLGDIVSLGQAFPDVFQRLNIDEILTRIGTARGIDTGGLIKSQAQLQQEAMEAQKAQEDAMMMETAQKAAPEMVRQVGNAAQNG